MLIQIELALSFVRLHRMFDFFFGLMISVRPCSTQIIEYK